MILKKISLPAIAMANMYKYSLVDFENDKRKSIQKIADIQFLGGNNKHILFLIDNSDGDFLPENQLAFLSGILTACKLCIDDIAIVNLNKKEESDFNKLPDALEAAIVIAAGIELSVLELPFKIPPFQVQQYKGKKYVSIPLLDTIKNDPVLKRQLWELLKILFPI